MNNHENTTVKSLDRYLLRIDVWGMAFGCMVGWGVFAMPGVIFLSSASPTETVIGMLIGAIVMIVIGACYGYLQERYSNCGGSFIFVLKTFGADHAYLCAW